MNIDTIKSMLRIADPANNAPAHERRSALTMAQREMDKQGLSYASLGFSQEDAERIANQFAVAFAKPKSKSNPISIFRGTRDRRSSSSKPAPQREPVRQARQTSETSESYFDQLEREDNEKFNEWYRNFVAYRAKLHSEQEAQDRYFNRLMWIVFPIVLVVIVALIWLLFEVM